jgi:ABC-type transporter Mla MlaB component
MARTRPSGGEFPNPDRQAGRVLLDDGVLRITCADGKPWLTIAGEIDESTYSGLLTALSEVSAMSGDIRIDLAWLSYCDLAGLRALFRLAASQGDGQSPRRIILGNCPPQLKNVVQILGWDRTPGMVTE